MSELEKQYLCKTSVNLQERWLTTSQRQILGPPSIVILYVMFPILAVRLCCYFSAGISTFNYVFEDPAVTIEGAKYSSRDILGFIFQPINETESCC